AAVGSKLPLLAIRASVTEEVMTADLVAGASDTINLAQAERAHRVIARELHSSRLQRAYDEAQQAVQKSRAQLDSVLTRSNDAILVVQEGILVEANQAWLELVGTQAAEITGQPVMDLFHADSHVALKGALSACLKGQWKDHALKVTARAGADGSGKVPAELLLTLGEHDGEPCVRIMVPMRKAATPAPAAEGTSPAAAAVSVPTLSPAPEAAAAAPARFAPQAPSTPQPAPSPKPVPSLPLADASTDADANASACAGANADADAGTDVDAKVREYDA